MKWNLQLIRLRYVKGRSLHGYLSNLKEEKGSHETSLHGYLSNLKEEKGSHETSWEPFASDLYNNFLPNVWSWP